MTERIAAVVEDGKIVNLIVVAADKILEDTEIEYATIVGALVGDTVTRGGVPAIAVRAEETSRDIAQESTNAVESEKVKLSAILKLKLLDFSDAEIKQIIK